MWLNENGNWVVKPPEDYELRRDYKQPEYSNEYMDAIIVAIDNAADEEGMIGDFGCIDFLTKLVDAADDADIKKVFDSAPEHVTAIINAVERTDT